MRSTFAIALAYHKLQQRADRGAGHAGKCIAPPITTLDDRDIREWRRGRRRAAGWIIFVDPMDQLGNLLHRPDEVDDPISIISLRAELRTHPVLEKRLGRLPHVDVGIERR